MGRSRAWRTLCMLLCSSSVLAMVAQASQATSKSTNCAPALAHGYLAYPVVPAVALGRQLQQEEQDPPSQSPPPPRPPRGARMFPRPPRPPRPPAPPPPPPPPPPTPPPVAAQQPRLDISEISAMADTNPYKILMLAAWYEMTTSTDTTDPQGIWALAGVHGMSWSYNGIRPSGSGFCLHGQPAFGPWHRPYLRTFEQGLQAAAARAAAKFKDPQLRAKYTYVAKTIRMPYWDWTNPTVPAILTSSTVKVLDSSGKPTSIPNPFGPYHYPSSPGGGRGGSVSRGTSWAPTMASSANTFAWQMSSFIRSNDWGCSYAPDFRSSRCAGNLELTHNNIHNILGGTNGEMATVAYAGFDPMFWLHHAMVDRCLWLFQNNNGGWQGAASYVPFLSLGGDASNLKSYNYSYRDPMQGSNLPNRRKLLSQNPDALPAELPALDSGAEVGSPAAVAAVKRQLDIWEGGYTGYSWQLQFVDMDRRQLDQAVHVHVFLANVPGVPPFPESRRMDPNSLRLRPDYCGSIAGFNELMEMIQEQQQQQLPDGYAPPGVTAVSLNECLKRAGIDPDIQPKDPADALQGPQRPAVTVADLKFVALNARGNDVTERFKFGKPEIGWSLGVVESAGQAAAAAAPAAVGSETAAAAAAGAGADGSLTFAPDAPVFALKMGSFT